MSRFRTRAPRRDRRKGMSEHLPHTRPPLERMLQIHQAIHEAGYPNATQLARRMEVSTKSIHRDIEFMRDRLGLPVAFDARRNGYYYTEEVGQFPTLRVTEGELFALVVAEKSLQQYRGTPFEKPLVSAFRKMCDALPRAVSFNLNDWERSISFRTSVQPVVDLEVFGVLARAAAQQRRLRLRYRKPGSSTAEDRVVDPYHLANINGEWFLFAWCHLRQDFRTFVPARMEAVEALEECFRASHHFDLEQRLRDSFGVVAGTGDYQVTIRFAPAAADYIAEKQWHASQRIENLDDGSLLLHLRLSSLEEVRRWVLSWGDQATVLSPPELRTRLQAVAAGMKAAYAATGED